ncbi:MAG TPA: toll/interleukin-1 receptor domain-containing protein [Terriglobales bacterium]|nr:toll/interleukin-1 receptor domain-containing protein [Terriglobales bacterium]
MAHDVFISYSSKDKTVADAVCARLEARGIRCWIAPRDVQPGQPYGEEIIDAIHGSKTMVLVFSSNANASPHIPKEIERAVSHGVSIIPFRVEAVAPAKSLDYFISSVHWLDAITPPLESHLETLANTLLAVLQVEGKPPAEVVVPVVVPVQAPKKRTGLFVGVASLVLLAALTVYFLSRPGETAQPSHVGGDNAPQALISPAPARDPVIGCWTWFNGAPVTINSDGRIVAEPFTGKWQRVGQRSYHLTWPEAVDAITISADGNSLSGSNQYGFPTSGTRLAPGAGIAGAWRWPNGAIVMITPQGTFSVGPFSGRWRATGSNTFNLTWPKPVDSVNLSSDSRRIAGHNQYGVAISGTRTGGCGV